MLNIYAQTFMTATRTGEICVTDVPSRTEAKRHRWFPLRKARCINPLKL